MGNSNTIEQSNISVTVNASTNTNEAYVNAQGSIVSSLAYNDLSIFNIHDANIWKGAKNIPIPDYLNGYSLTKAMLGARAPFKYELVGQGTWREIKKTIRPVQTKIIKVYSEPATAAKRKFTNKSSIKGKYKVGVTHEEENKLSTKWTTKIDFNADLKIDYKIVKSEGSGNMSFKSSWCKETHKYEAVTIGSETAVEVELEPGQTVFAKLHVTRCIMDVEVTYEASLDGDVICLYENFWKPFSSHYVNVNINNVLRAANQATTVTTSEVLKICFSTDGEILLSDN